MCSSVLTCKLTDNLGDPEAFVELTFRGQGSSPGTLPLRTFSVHIDFKASWSQREIGAVNNQQMCWWGLSGPNFYQAYFGVGLLRWSKQRTTFSHQSPNFYWFYFYNFHFFWHVVGMWDLSSLTKDQTCIPCSEAQSPTHWTARKVPMFDFSKFNLNWKPISWKKKIATVLWDPKLNRLPERNDLFQSSLSARRDMGWKWG